VTLPETQRLVDGMASTLQAIDDPAMTSVAVQLANASFIRLAQRPRHEDVDHDPDAVPNA
jgi:hypothetical protein